MKSNAITDTIFNVSSLLNAKQRKGAALLIGGITANAFLDVLGLAAVIPVVTVALNPNLIETNSYLNYVYNSLEFNNPDSFLVFLVFFLFVAFLVKNLFSLSIVYLKARYALNLATELSCNQFTQLFQRGYQEVRNIESGDFLFKIRQAPSLMVQGALLPLLSIVSESLVVLLILLGVSLYNIKLIGILGVVMGCGVYFSHKYIRDKIKRISDESKLIVPKVMSSINESFRGFLDIVIFNKTKFFLDKNLSLQKKEYDLMRRRIVYGGYPGKINEIMAIIGVVIIFLYSILISDNRNELLLVLSLFAVSAYRVMPSLNKILAALISVRGHMYAVEALFPLTESNNNILQDNSEFTSFEKRIELSNVGFKFEKNGQYILQDINLYIDKGEVVGFVGESGSGKTTLLRILLRQYEESEGTMSVDGIIIGDNNRMAWLTKIGYVQQDVFLLNATLLENIAFGELPEHIDENKVAEAIKQASLESFVSHLPLGLQTPIGELGSKLSGGQRQRIAIARALYKDAEVFIFDEATSALDPETEKMITEAIHRLSEKNNTVIIVAHRFTTLQGCDRILEIEQGRISKKYQYNQLLKEKLGLVKDQI